MTGSDRDRRLALAFAAVTSLFFAWGFITSNNDPLIVALRAAFSLDYTEALLTQIVFFLAYGLLSLPAAWLTSRIGPVDMILGSLALMACGCLLVVVSTNAGDFRPILAALFVLAAGFTALQVAANPLAAELGPPQRTHFRLNFAQAFSDVFLISNSTAPALTCCVLSVMPSPPSFSHRLTLTEAGSAAPAATDARQTAAVTPAIPKRALDRIMDISSTTDGPAPRRKHRLSSPLLG